MPKHHCYLEPYFGGGAILFNKDPSRIETINDLDDDVVNLFRTIRENREGLIEAIVMTPYARVEYNNAFPDKPEELSDVERAKNFLIRSGMGHGFRLCEKCGWMKDVYSREAAYMVRYWNDLPEVITNLLSD